MRLASSVSIEMFWNLCFLSPNLSSYLCDYLSKLIAITFSCALLCFWVIYPHTVHSVEAFCFPARAITIATAIILENEDNSGFILLNLLVE
jgi:hypothetical protein